MNKKAKVARKKHQKSTKKTARNVPTINATQKEDQGTMSKAKAAKNGSKVPAIKVTIGQFQNARMDTPVPTITLQERTGYKRRLGMGKHKAAVFLKAACDPEIVAQVAQWVKEQFQEEEN